MGNDLSKVRALVVIALLAFVGATFGAVSITQSPTNTTVCPGATATFSVTATGTGNLRYQWRKGATNLVNQTNSTLVLPNVNAGSAGTYSVVVNSTAGGSATSGNATLTVNTFVSTTSLTNATRFVGSVVVFSTVASGSAPISYQWRKDGTNLPGRTSSSLVLSNLTVTNSGIYSVVVSGPCNSSTQSALLDVDFCFPAVDVALVIDRSGSMLGQPYADARTASSNFVKNLKFGATNDRAAIVSYNSAATLDRVLTNSLSSLNTGIAAIPAANGYTCISCGIATGQTELASVRHNTNALPVLVLMSDGLPTQGDTASNALYQATIAKNAGTRIFTVGLGDVDHALMRGIASSSNDYFYTTNSAQLTALFNEISSIICRPPTNIFVSGLTNQTVCSGGNVSWSITASNCDAFTYQWRKDGANLPGQTNHTLTLNNVTVSNAGVYTLIVGSACQTLTNSATLTVNQSLLVNTPPANQTSFVGSNATFSVSAMGTGIAYQWFFNGSIVGTSSTLTLNNLTTNQAGSYCVVISGVCGVPITNCATLTIQNRAPIALPDSYTITEDTTLTVPAPGVLANDSDPDGDTLTSTIVNQAANGTVVLNANGSFTYTPQGNFNGTDTFTYRASDMKTSSAPITVTITVTPRNDAPVAVNDSYMITEDTTLTIAAPGVLANDSDVDGDTLTSVILSNALHGTVTLNADGSFTYQPATNYTGPDSFLYRARDASTFSAPATVNITVSTANDAPAANNDSYSVNADTALTIVAPGVLANDTDVENNPLTAAVVNNPANGTLALNANGSFSYMPLTNFSGIDSFTYRAHDGQTNSNPATVTITVIPQNIVVTNPPTDRTNCPGDTVTFEVSATGTALTYQWYFGTNTLVNQTNSVLALTNVAPVNDGIYCVVIEGAAGGPITNCARLLVNLDTTVLTPPTNQVVCPGQNASFTVTATGTDLTYEWYHSTTRIDTAQTDTLVLSNVTATSAGQYTVITRGICGKFVTNTTTLVVNENVTIVTPPITQTSYVGSNVTFNVVATGTALTYGWFFNGTLIGTNSNLDLNNLTTNRAGLYCVVVSGACGTPVTNCVPLIIDNRPPAARNDSYSVDEDTPLSIAAPGVLANDFDIDGDTISAVLVFGPANGVLTLRADGSFTYGPNRNFNGTDTFTYRASDTKTTSAPAVVTITVRPVNDTPFAAADDRYVASEDTLLVVPATSGVLTNDLDVDNDLNALSAILVATTTNGVLQLSSNGGFTYLPKTNFFGVDHFTYRATDGLATSAVAIVTINIAPINDPPTVDIIAPTNGAFFVALATIRVTATAADLDGAVTNVTLFSGTNVLQSFATAPYTFVLNDRLPGMYSFRATATDDRGLSSTSPIVSVTVTSPPLVIVCADPKTVELGTAWTFNSPTVFAGCGTNFVTVINTVTNPLCGNTFSATRTWRATDQCGNTAECSQLVTVVDTTPPTITAPPDKVVELGVVWTFDTPTATDLSGATVSVLTTTTNAGVCGNGYVATRLWVARDGCGNTNTAQQMVSVVDRSAPTITCSTNKTVELGTVWTFDPPTATDLSSNVITIVATITNRNSSCGNGFVATRTWRATDACGNSNQCSQVVTVLDRTAPTIICSPDKIVELGTVWSFDPPAGSDLSSFTITVVSTTTNAGTCGNGFVATRTWRATDACGNSNQCSQVVTVLDRTAPSITCPQNKTVEAGVAWTFDEPTANDLSSFTINILSTTTNTLCGGSYVATRRWSAVDACGNSNTCQQVVTVNDSTMPVVEIISPTNNQVFIHPASISIVATAFDAGGVASVEFYASSNRLTTLSNAPYFFIWTNAPLGSNGLVAVARDFCGQSTTSSVVSVFVTTNTLFAAGPMTLNRQTGLFDQYLTNYNLTVEPWPNGVRVFVDTTNHVWNATGTNSQGVAYIDSNTPIVAGGASLVLVRYYVPDTRIIPQANIVTVPLPYTKPAPVPPRILPVAGDQFTVSFESEASRWYYIETSADLKQWTVNPTPKRGTGATMQWSVDKSSPHQFHRVLLVP